MPKNLRVKIFAVNTVRSIQWPWHLVVTSIYVVSIKAVCNRFALYSVLLINLNPIFWFLKHGIIFKLVKKSVLHPKSAVYLHFQSQLIANLSKVYCWRSDLFLKKKWLVCQEQGRKEIQILRSANPAHCALKNQG